MAGPTSSGRRPDLAGSLARMPVLVPLLVLLFGARQPVLGTVALLGAVAVLATRV